MWASLVGAAAATAAASTCAADSNCADVDAARCLFLRWVNSTSIPGVYTTAATRLTHSSHPGDLTHTRIFYDGPLGATTSEVKPLPAAPPLPLAPWLPAAPRSAALGSTSERSEPSSRSRSAWIHA